MILIGRRFFILQAITDCRRDVAKIQAAHYFDPMTQAVAHLLEEAGQLSVEERAELAERIVESLAHDIPESIAQSQMSEVRRRIAEVESGEVTLIPGEEALARVRQLVASPNPAGRSLRHLKLFAHT